MTAIEVALLLIGVVFILASFFIVEKLSPTELSRVAELSEEELRIVMDRELESAGAKITDMADHAVDLSMDQIQRKMEKDTNEKIMAISEYSDSVINQLQKMNHEVTFLYSMLGDKHNELNESMTKLNALRLECQELCDETLSLKQAYEELKNQPVLDMAEVEVIKTVDEIPVQAETSEPPCEDVASSEIADETSAGNVKDEILKRYRAGEELNNIARDLSLGYGEVKLIVELYKGEINL